MEQISQVPFLVYCIALYLSICIALLVRYTVQKHCQCARPMRKILVLRKTKEDERLPVRQVERIKGESAFQGVGPIEAKD